MLCVLTGSPCASDACVAGCREEEASFSRTLAKGIERFKKAAGAAKNGKLPSYDAFALWDSFGFPIDLTQVTIQPQQRRLMQQNLPAVHSCP